MATRLRISPRPARRLAHGGRQVLAVVATTLCLGLAGCATWAPGAMPSADPANPIELNEAAVAHAARGEIETAWLLLERAALLAPADSRIAANLAVLREYRGAALRRGIVVTPARASAAARIAPQPEQAPPVPPPALWPAGASGQGARGP